MFSANDGRVGLVLRAQSGAIDYDEFMEAKCGLLRYY